MTVISSDSSYCPAHSERSSPQHGQVFSLSSSVWRTISTGSSSWGVHRFGAVPTRVGRQEQSGHADHRLARRDGAVGDVLVLVVAAGDRLDGAVHHAQRIAGGESVLPDLRPELSVVEALDDEVGAEVELLVGERRQVAAEDTGIRVVVGGGR